jgi:uncharacterized protein involved in exopolysaccharide biosynthesis
MGTYIGTVRTYWKILLIPVITAAVIGGWFTFGAAKTYRSTASVWIDYGPASGSWLDPSVALEGAGDPLDLVLQAELQGASDPPAAVLQADQLQGATDPPATVVQAELTQLLDSDTFDLALGDKSLLRAYLASTTRPRGFSPTALLSHSKGSLSYQIERSIHEHVSSAVSGPQVLSLSYTGPTPSVSRSVLSSLLTQLKGKTRQLGIDFSIAEDRYYVRQLSYRQTDAASLQQAAASYLRLHPTATAATDTIYAALLSAARSSSSKLATPAAAIARAARLDPAGGTPLIKLIDAPTLPIRPVKGIGAELEGVLAGAFAGLVLSLMVTILLTPASATRWDQDELGRLASARRARKRTARLLT